jgi:hypothetical protein
MAYKFKFFISPPLRFCERKGFGYFCVVSVFYGSVLKLNLNQVKIKMNQKFILIVCIKMNHRLNIKHGC